MALGYLVVAILAAAVATFALQNGEPTQVRFIVWTVDLPLAGLILIALASGLILAGLPLLIRGWRLGARLRAADRRLADLEAAAARREAAPPPPPERPRPTP